MLEHETDLAIARVQAADVSAMEANMPAGLMLQPGDNAQQRGFRNRTAPATRPSDLKEYPVRYRSAPGVRPNDFLMLAISMLMMFPMLCAFS